MFRTLLAASLFATAVTFGAAAARPSNTNIPTRQEAAVLMSGIFTGKVVLAAAPAPVAGEQTLLSDATGGAYQLHVAHLPA